MFNNSTEVNVLTFIRNTPTKKFVQDRLLKQHSAGAETITLGASDKHQNSNYSEAPR